jgi:DNA-binding NarL/FixJ family response regulator
MVEESAEGTRSASGARGDPSSMARGAPARVLIADDHDVVRQGFRLVLGSQPDLEVVGEASDGREALERARRLRPDLVLMDVTMPVMDGLEATRRLKAEMPGVCVLMFTSHEEPEYLLEAIEAGAAGYVLKGAGGDFISLRNIPYLQAIRELLYVAAGVVVGYVVLWAGIGGRTDDDSS